MGDFDKIFKENIEAVFLPMAEEILGISIKETYELKDKIQTTIEREPDFLKIVIDQNGKKWILHLEFQTTNDPKMIYRMAEYRAILQRKYAPKVSPPHAKGIPSPKGCPWHGEGMPSGWAFGKGEIGDDNNPLLAAIGFCQGHSLGNLRSKYNQITQKVQRWLQTILHILNAEIASAQGKNQNFRCQLFKLTF